jgi:hypothetical protein
MSDNLNVDLLIKIMSMTTSDNDGQALVAMRKANEQLKKWGWTWESILRGKISVAANPFVNVAMEDLLKKANGQAQPPSPSPSYAPSYTPPPPRKPKKPKVNLSDLGL